MCASEGSVPPLKYYDIEHTCDWSVGRGIAQIVDSVAVRIWRTPHGKDDCVEKRMRREATQLRRLKKDFPDFVLMVGTISECYFYV